MRGRLPCLRHWPHSLGERTLDEVSPRHVRSGSQKEGPGTEAWASQITDGLERCQLQYADVQKIPRQQAGALQREIVIHRDGNQERNKHPSESGPLHAGLLLRPVLSLSNGMIHWAMSHKPASQQRLTTPPLKPRVLTISVSLRCLTLKAKLFPVYFLLQNMPESDDRI